MDLKPLLNVVRYSDDVVNTRMKWDAWFCNDGQEPVIQLYRFAYAKSVANIIKVITVKV